MQRRVLQKFSDKSAIIDVAMRGLIAANYELRSRTQLDLGMLFFLPIHEGFGGRIRYLISGGSALPADVLKTFYGMGFSFFEGYGLTETAPVLTVTSPKEKPIPGSVGRSLPGLEVKIDAPDGSGRRRGDRARPQRHGRLLGGRGGDRRDDQGRLVPHRRSRAHRRRTGTCTWSGDRRT